MPPRNTIDNVLYPLIIQENGCWIWPGQENGKGYGLVRFNLIKKSVHRVVYTHFRGIIPAGMQLDHLCRNRACANPWHLEPVTAQENCLRGNGPAAVQARQTHCKRGHELSGENLYVFPCGRRRLCRACSRAWEQVNRRKSHEVVDAVETPAATTGAG